MEDEAKIPGRTNATEMWIDDQDKSVYTLSGFGNYGGSTSNGRMDPREFYLIYDFLPDFRVIRRLRSTKVGFSVGNLGCKLQLVTC